MTGRLVTVGEALGVLRTGETGSLAHLAELAIGTGGAEANVAIGAARLGATSVFAGRVGADSLGRRIVRELRAEAVRTEIRTDDAATGLLLKESPRAGHTAVTYYRTASAGSRIRPADLDALDLTEHDVLHLTGILPALSASARATTEHALDLAEAAGSTVSFDVNHRAKLWPAAEAAEVYRAIASRADIVFAGIDEAQLLATSGAGGEDTADLDSLTHAITALGPTEVVLKLGAHGAAAWVDGGRFDAAAVRIDPIDTVGAGDAFVAGYLAARLAGESPDERLRLGTACGAMVCLHPGDWEGAPTRNEVAAFLAGGDPVSR